MTSSVATSLTLLAAVHGALHRRATRLTVVVALGTHAQMTGRSLARHLGYELGALAERYPSMSVLNHEWWDPGVLVELGTISADRVAELSEGRLHQGVPVRGNRAVVDHDVTLIVGPVFPHEVVGFSGGNKYLFPGVSGRELIDLSHWLGALITSAEIIGTKGVTPVRAMIDEAASMVPTERLAICVVTGPSTGELRSVAFGEPEAAWAAAADVSAEAHIRYLDAPVRRVLSLLPARYDDIWTGAKGFYKVEPIVTDGGEVVLYAPQITEVSAMHPQVQEIGYHCRDYFVKQWDRFKDRPWADLAHSTQLRGAGTYDPVEGEHLRVNVTLATGIPEEVARSVNLGYVAPDEVDVEAWRQEPDAARGPGRGRGSVPPALSAGALHAGPFEALRGRRRGPADPRAGPKRRKHLVADLQRPADPCRPGESLRVGICDAHHPEA